MVLQEAFATEQLSFQLLLAKMVDLKILGKDVLENKAKLRELEIKLDAIVSLLEKEGILTKQEVEQEFDELIKDIKS